MAEFPIIISPRSMQLNTENMKDIHDETGFQTDKKTKFVDSDEVFLYDPSKNSLVHKNVITDEYMNYVNKIDPQICSSIGYTRLVNMNLIRKVDGQVSPASITSGMSSRVSSSAASMGNMASMQGMRLSSYPMQLNNEEGSYLERHYNLLAGTYPKSEDDLVLVVDTKNRVSIDTLKSLGFKTDDVKCIKFSDIIGAEYKVVDNDDYYIKTEMGTYLPGTDYQRMYDSNNSITLKVSGIVRQNLDSDISILSPGLAYSDELSTKIIGNAVNSDIVKAQREADYNIFTLDDMTDEEKNVFLSVLGGNAIPFMVMIYPNSFEDKDAVTNYLDTYNTNKVQEDKIIYTDLASTISSLTSGIMNGITLVLIAFAAISLIVSLIMIGIITYTSVLERTREIGILKALGARKKDITRVFDAETCILGIFSGVLGIAIAFLCTIPINSVIYKVAELENVAQLQIEHAVILIIISTVLTMLGGHIPARMASKKDAVEALRSE